MQSILNRDMEIRLYLIDNSKNYLRINSLNLGKIEILYRPKLLFIFVCNL